MPWGDVVTGGPGSVTPFPRKFKGTKPPKTPAVVKGLSVGGGDVISAASRGLFWVGLGYSAWQAAKYLRDPDFDPWGRVRANMAKVARDDRLLRDKMRRLRLKLEKERKDAAAALESRIRGEEAAQEVIAYRGYVPGAPPRRLVPGTPEYAQETQRQVEEARRRAIAAAGGSLPPQTEAERIAAAAPPVAAQAKKTLRDRAAALLANPIFSLSLLGATALPWSKLAGGKKSAAAPLPEFPLEPDLTAFEPQGVAFGELGGELAFEPEPDTQTRGEECERIDPARTPGECRQGWFSETPKGLYLKEWSRRPCQ